MTRLDYDDTMARYPLSCTTEYRGFKVLIEHETHAENPLLDSDCYQPLLAYGRDGLTEYGSIPNPIDLISDWHLARKETLIAEVLELGDIKGEIAEYRDESSSVAALRRDIFEYRYEEIREHFVNVDFFSVAVELFKIAKVPALHSATVGYSQGDYVDCLVVETPEWCEKMGLNRKGPNAAKEAEISMQTTIDQFGAWMWGDVYTYKVEGLDDAGYYEFYGSDMFDNGAEYYIKQDIDAHIAHLRSERAAKLKAWIKSKCPLQHRVFNDAMAN